MNSKKFSLWIPASLAKNIKIWLPTIAAWTLVLGILHQDHTKAEITTEEILITKVTETTKNSIKNILEIPNLCTKNEILTIRKPTTENTKISIKYQCQPIKHNEEIPSAYGSPNPF